MKNIQNLIKNKPVQYVDGMNHIWSNGPRPKGDTIQQLLDLKEWSQDSARYERRLNFRAGQAKKKEQAEALKNPKKWINNPKKLDAFIKSEDPVPRKSTPPKKKEIKIAGIKDSSLYKLLKNPKVIGVDLGHDSILEIINLIQNSGLVQKPKVQPKKDDDKQLIRWALEESPVPIVKNPVLKKAIDNQQLEEKINQIAYQRKLAENKISGLNEEFVKQKLRERMS